MASSRDRGRAEGSFEPAVLLKLGVLKLGVLLSGALSVCACGSSAPSEASIYHDPALRPGAIEAASDDERELLSRLSTLPAGQPVRLGSRTFVIEPGYTAASGRRCRAISSDDAHRLACEATDGWIFVPEVRQEPHEVAQ